MEKKVLKTDVISIERTLERELSFAGRFEPFLKEFLLNDYTIKTDRWHTIRDMIYNGTLDTFMREQALIKSPYFNTMPVKKERQLELVDVDVIYPNYNSLKTLFAGIQSLPLNIRSKINSFWITKQNKLALSDTFIQKVRYENTLFGTAKQLETFTALSSLLASAKRIQQESGVSIFSNGMILNNHNGNLDTAEINAGRLVMSDRELQYF